jgi:hypothetical protein
MLPEADQGPMAGRIRVDTRAIYSQTTSVEQTSCGLNERRIRTYDRSMSQLASIGYNGQPVRSPFRVVRPPIKVLVDLTVLFPREPHRSGRYQPNGLQLHKVVEGRLTCWGLCEQGDWWGLVTYPIAYGSKQRTVTHWIPAWTLRRAR